MSRHRAFLEVDGDSRATRWVRSRGPRHRNTLNERIYMHDQIREEMAFFRWCDTNQLDPLDTESMVAYEDDVGFLYIDEPEDHR